MSEHADTLGNTALYWYVENGMQMIEVVTVIRQVGRGSYFLCAFEEGDEALLHADDLTPTSWLHLVPSAE